MLKRLNDPKYASVRTPSKDAVGLLRDHVLPDNNNPIIAEIGVGIGATTIALCDCLNDGGEIHLFDYDTTLNELLSELADVHFRAKIVPHPNSRKTYDSYAWRLAKLLLEMRALGDPGIFDFVYLDGAHAFQHDAPAAVCLKELLKVHGYLLFDDFSWTFEKSPTLNPQIHPSTANLYSAEQIREPHIALICKAFFDSDSRFELVDLGYEGKELRRAYRRII